ncbi:hypothetical protein AVW12_12065 [Priestia aryabhattai]|nr:hypothetical protein AVW12_12065 [Priestia aryabhattai]
MKTSAGKAEEVRPRRSGSDNEAHRPPACTEINSGVRSDSYWLIYLIYLSLYQINLAMSQPLLFFLLEIFTYMVFY